MELKITNKKDNSLLHRVEVEAELTAVGATPSNKEVAKELSSQLKVDEKLIVIKHIYSRFGTQMSDVLAYAYNHEEKMKEIEILKEPKEEKKAEAPAEAKPEAKPAEKKKEEAPAEKPAEEKKE